MVGLATAGACTWVQNETTSDQTHNRTRASAHEPLSMHACVSRPLLVHQRKQNSSGTHQSCAATSNTEDLQDIEMLAFNTPCTLPRTSLLISLYLAERWNVCCNGFSCPPIALQDSGDDLHGSERISVRHVDRRKVSQTGATPSKVTVTRTVSGFEC